MATTKTAKNTKNTKAAAPKGKGAFPPLRLTSTLAHNGHCHIPPSHPTRYSFSTRLSRNRTAGPETKAKTAKKAALQGAHAHASRKVRQSVSFHRPKTLRLSRQPRYPRKSIPHAPRLDQFRTIVSCVPSLE